MAKQFQNGGSDLQSFHILIITLPIKCIKNVIILIVKLKIIMLILRYIFIY